LIENVSLWSWCFCLACVQVKALAADQLQGRAEGEQKWQQQIATWRQDLKVPLGFRPFDKLRRPIQGISLNARISAILNMVTAEKIGGDKRKSKDEILSAVSCTVVDVSQNPMRRNYTPSHGTNHTMCTSSVLVHLGKFRTVVPAEMMLWQGHNISRLTYPDSESNRTWRSLAGEGMALPSIGTVIWCLFLTGTWPTQ